MNILYHIQQKGRVTILMVAVFFLVIYSSYTYNRSISEMGELTSEMYKDRLIAQDYIYKFGKILYDRKLVLSDRSGADIDHVFKNDSASMAMLLGNYEHTKLTKNEKVQFLEFRKNVMLMMFYERKYLATASEVAKSKLLEMQMRSLDTSLIKLDKLAEIQASSGKELDKASKKIVDYSTLLTKFDWAILITIGLIIQVIIFTSRSTIPKDRQNEFLN